MSTIALPAGFCPDAFSLRLATTQRVHASPFGGAEQAVDLLNDRWLVFLSMPARLHADAARVEAFLAALRGMTNTANLYHYARAAPRGTMRGTPTCGAAAQGASSLALSAAGAGATLLAGDMIGIAGLLLQAAADATASGAGAMTVTLVNRLRTAIGAAAPVTWDRPTAPFRLASASAMQYIPGYAETVSMDFVEVVV